MIVERIAADTGLPVEYVSKVARTASHRYKSYEIPKAGGGTRIIHHPARELKLFQSWLVKNVFSNLPVHENAYAYCTGKSILQNAEIHSAHNFLLRVDFRDFFHSITADDVRTLLTKSAVSVMAGAEDVVTIVGLSCRQGRLTIGAPSSPAISNAVMYEFDVEWTKRCNVAGVTYSRYADDLYFSTNEPNRLTGLLDELREDVRSRAFPRLAINDAKTVFTSRKRKRIVTGLILTSDYRISLGRSLKRKVRSQLFNYGRSERKAKETARLRGLLSYAHSVEPNYIAALRNKFGLDLFGLWGKPEQ